MGRIVAKSAGLAFKSSPCPDDIQLWAFGREFHKDACRCVSANPWGAELTLSGSHSEFGQYLSGSFADESADLAAAYVYRICKEWRILRSRLNERLVELIPT